MTGDIIAKKGLPPDAGARIAAEERMSGLPSYLSGMGYDVVPAPSARVQEHSGPSGARRRQAQASAGGKVRARVSELHVKMESNGRGLPLPLSHCSRTLLP